MQLGDNWHVNAPWASLVCSTQVPDDIFKTTLELTDQIFDDVNHDSAGAGLAGQIQEEYYITQEKLIEKHSFSLFFVSSSLFSVRSLNAQTPRFA